MTRSKVLGLAPLLMGLLLLSPALCWGEEITASKVFSVLQGFKRDLDLIRLETGAPKSKRYLFQVSDASVSEVFYQAITLCGKAGQLRFEWTRTLGNCPPTKIGMIQHLDVINQVKSALAHLQAVKNHFNIDEATHYPPRDAAKIPTDVFNDIVKGNRQLNRMLKKRYLPDDVFREVTLGVYYAADLLSRFPDIEQRIGPTPAFVRKKTPTDVYIRLVEGYALVRRISRVSGETSLHFKVNEAELTHVTPGDVYDVATLIVSNLAYLYWRSGGRETIQAYQPPPKIPAQVFQRADILLQQLRTLLEHVQQHPNWLNKGL